MNNIQLFQRSKSLWSQFLDANPQLFREIKGKLKTRNVIIAAAISIATQFIIGISLLGELPEPDPEGLLNVQYGRYGMGNGYSNSLAYTKDLLDNWVINWQLLWLDLFITLSIISIFALLIIGTYMLVADMVKEEDRGTLNFIRLTPQSASNVLLGKILGVPILLYTAISLFLPLHLIAGLGARIPLVLIISFDAIIIASCAFCYSLALLWSLMNIGISGFKPWLASGMVGLLSLYMTVAIFHHNTLMNGGSWNYIFLFNPAIALSYLIDATYLPSHKIEFLPVENLAQLSFYGQTLWTKASLGMGFMLFNFSLWTSWCWSVLERRFHNPERTLFSKTQSYWITSWLTAIGLGFTLQHHGYSYDHQLKENFILLQFSLCIYGLVLIAALSPHRQALHDWARYRHQTNNKVWHELVFGENSPSTIAIAINMAIAVIYITPSVFTILNADLRYIYWGFILTAGSVLLYAAIAQLVLTMRTPKRAVWAVISLFSMTVVPPLCLGFAQIEPHAAPGLWLFSFLPVVAIEYANISAVMFAVLGQFMAISLVGLQMTRKLKQAGASETKMLFDRTDALT